MALPLSLSQCCFDYLDTPSSPTSSRSPISADWTFEDIPIYVQLAPDNSQQSLKSVLLSGDGDDGFPPSPSAHSAMSAGTFGPGMDVMVVPAPSSGDLLQADELLKSFDVLPSLGLGFEHDLDGLKPSKLDDRHLEGDGPDCHPRHDGSESLARGESLSRKRGAPALRICTSLPAQASPSTSAYGHSLPLSAPPSVLPDDRSDQSIHTGHIDSQSSLSTVLFAPPSPGLPTWDSRSLSPTDSDFGYKKRMRKYAKDANAGNLLHGLLSRKSAESLRSPHWRTQATPSMSSRGLTSSASSASSLQADASSCPSSPSYSASLRSSHSASSYESCSTCSSASSVGPGALSQELPQALKDIIIDMWIDQEGFRAVRPAFRLMGYSSVPAPSTGLGSDQRESNLIRADFLPVKRQIFTFHHAALDGPPIIRRMTINGDESRDYISRQASLIIRTNGVYVVRGSESCRPNKRHKGCSDPTLDWLFEYFVEDRRAETTGRIISGEKTFTPLRFSCSPGLLQRSSGHKISVMQVLRKNMAQKLIAEKLPPPRVPQPRPVVENATAKDEELAQQEGMPASQYELNEELARNVGSRLRSDGPERLRSASVGAADNVDPGGKRLSLPVNSLQDPRRVISEPIRPPSELNNLLSTASEEGFSGLTVPPRRPGRVATRASRSG
ncbi:hypothetical protein OE88DRAFT_1650149 [Heliocybe sulcata]|uniref:Uncharacterized protein n=1 Tax=Heliocybe sulcata TaxID=5364 RepID=A0A5C3NKQ4_9AGAM|nr:hypothetical protein OE88DRAFT_1650149 [Heliocybe sulcata]